MNAPDRTSPVSVKPRKLVLTTETLRRLSCDDEGPTPFAHPTTTVNTIKSGCC